jgi:hypothetical protein
MLEFFPKFGPHFRPWPGGFRILFDGFQALIEDGFYLVIDIFGPFRFHTFIIAVSADLTSCRDLANYPIQPKRRIIMPGSPPTHRASFKDAEGSFTELGVAWVNSGRGVTLRVKIDALQELLRQGGEATIYVNPNTPKPKTPKAAEQRAAA